MIEFSQADVEQALGAVKTSWPRMGERATLAYRALVAEREQFRAIFAEFREAYDKYYEGDGSAHLLNMESKVRALLAKEPA